MPVELGGLNNRIADYYMAHSSIPSAIVWLHYGFFCSLSQRLRRQSLFRDKAETRQGPTLLCLFLAGLLNYILESQLLVSNSATYLGVSHLIEYHCLLFYNRVLLFWNRGISKRGDWHWSSHFFLCQWHLDNWLFKGIKRLFAQQSLTNYQDRKVILCTWCMLYRTWSASNQKSKISNLSRI